MGDQAAAGTFAAVFQPTLIEILLSAGWSFSQSPNSSSGRASRTDPVSRAPGLRDAPGSEKLDGHASFLDANRIWCGILPRAGAESRRRHPHRDRRSRSRCAQSPASPIPNRFADLNTSLASAENDSRPSGSEPEAPSSRFLRASSRTGSTASPKSANTRPAILCIREQHEEQMLDLDTPVPQLPRVVPRVRDRLTRLLGEHLEQTTSIAAASAESANGACFPPTVPRTGSQQLAPGWR